ncbi:L-lactate permease [Actinomyces oricola]|uniref:L-lactate permease n=1 Tax=Actinomyces oricola TaxID=206043 RepID=UPI000FFE7DCD|nr:lactate permease LctP family transporter [Actinomyces oricola]
MPFARPAALAAFFTPSTTAVGRNVFLTAAVGLLPLIAFFVLMGVLKVKTHWCSMISLGLAAVIAIVFFDMPVAMTAMSATQGAIMGLIPIVYIIVAAVWLYNLTEASGRSADLRAVFNAIGKGDTRAQALIVAFSFCGLLEGLAGFGAPVAIAAAMVAALGLPKLKSAVVVMVGNAINVGFGAMAIPTTTAARLGGQEPVTVAIYMGRLTWILCAVIPIVLLFILDGARGVKQLWPLAVVAGLATGAGHFLTPSLSYELTAVLASLLGLAASYVFLLLWTPTTPQEYRSEVKADDVPGRERVILALLPYVLVVVMIAVTKLWTLGVNLNDALKGTDVAIQWPGVYGRLLDAAGRPATSAVYTLQILSNPGTWIFLTGLIVTIVYAARSVPGTFEMSVGKGLATLASTCRTLRLAVLTIVSVMALAYVMNFSGQTTAIGAALAATGAAYAFLSPVLGWIGTAVAGSATSAGALFANLQATAAQGAGLDPRTLLAANTIGGGLGKIVSPQNLAIATTAVDAPGQDAEVLRKVAPYSLGLLLALCALVFIASQGRLGGYMPS